VSHPRRGDVDPLIMDYCPAEFILLCVFQLCVGVQTNRDWPLCVDQTLWACGSARKWQFTWPTTFVFLM
jgi:hypothetical protein